MGVVVIVKVHNFFLKCYVNMKLFMPSVRPIHHPPHTPRFCLRSVHCSTCGYTLQPLTNLTSNVCWQLILHDAWMCTLIFYIYLWHHTTDARMATISHIKALKFHSSRQNTNFLKWIIEKLYRCMYAASTVTLPVDGSQFPGEWP